MRLVYNLGGINHAREVQRIKNRTYKRQSFSSCEKMKIVRAVDKMMAEENVTFAVAAARLGVHRSNLASWMKNKTALLDSLVENRLSLHKGPMSILEVIKDELLEFITHWRDKGFPVMCLVRKVCALKPKSQVLREKFRGSQDGDFSLSCSKQPHPPRRDPQGPALSWRGER